MAEDVTTPKFSLLDSVGAFDKVFDPLGQGKHQDERRRFIEALRAMDADKVAAANPEPDLDEELSYCHTCKNTGEIRVMDDMVLEPCPDCHRAF